MTNPKKPDPTAVTEMSRDVVELEKLLRTQGPKTEFWQAVEIQGDVAPDVDNEMGWAEYGDGKFRMLYRRTKFDRHDEPVSEKITLLSDAPTPVRPQLTTLLPLFMEAFAEYLQSGEAPDTDDSLDDDEEEEDDA